MGQALYRKHRSRSLSEIVGQEHIVTTLQNALKAGKISHAYLFTGPRGVGKTSIARILAHEINGLPYDDATPHIDIIEIDAASNRRIDEIRDLRDKVHIAPTSAKYKVYIIDEVHMLTKEAFNALLKTLEEPPAHVIFILATTESHKLPETIVSRTQRFTFKAIDPAQAVEHLRSIAKDEGVAISDEALELVAEHGDGSFRDSISLLDQLSSQSQQVEADDVRQMLGIAPKTMVQGLLDNTLHGTPKDILDDLDIAAERGHEPAQLAKQLGQIARQQLLAGSPDAVLLTDLMHQLIDVPASSDPGVKLEVVLLGINLKTENPKAESLKPKQITSPKPETPNATPKAAPKEAKVEAEPVVVTDDFNQAWGNVLSAVKKQYNTLYGVLRMAQPEFSQGELTLKFQFPFHQKRLKEAKNQQIVADLMAAQLGEPVKVVCVLDKTAGPPPPAPAMEAPAAPNPLETISNIFGAAEVLES